MPYRKQLETEVEALKGWSGEKGYQFSVQFPSSNPLGFPDIKRQRVVIPDNLVAYNALSRSMDRSDLVIGTHFFLQDNKFTSIWSHPNRAVHRLQTLTDIVLGPDFSMYTDWPLAVQYFNKYRNHWCMALWQSAGLTVVPTVLWSGADSYEWCFEGLPEEATLAVSSVGCCVNQEYRAGFCEGYKEMVDRLRPKRVLFYGPSPAELPRGRERVQFYETNWSQHFKRGKVN
jgi:hypothetical protein